MNKKRMNKESENMGTARGKGVTSTDLLAMADQVIDAAVKYIGLNHEHWNQRYEAYFRQQKFYKLLEEYQKQK